MIRNKVKLPKKLELLHSKREMLKQLISDIDYDIEYEYTLLTNNITEKHNGKSISLSYNGITFNIKPLKGYNDYSITKNGHRLSRRYYDSIDFLKLDIVKGII
jgi:hypothetical protein